MSHDSPFVPDQLGPDAARTVRRGRDRGDFHPVESGSLRERMWGLESPSLSLNSGAGVAQPPLRPFEACHAV